MLVLFLLLFALALFVLAYKLLKKEDSLQEEKEEYTVSSDCCGAYEVCLTDSLLTVSEEIVYYEDEELDSLKNKTEYTSDEIKLFEEVFYTLKEEEVAGWLCSLQLRHISLPDTIKEEALLIVSERRM